MLLDGGELERLILNGTVADRHLLWVTQTTVLGKASDPQEVCHGRSYNRASSSN